MTQSSDSDDLKAKIVNVNESASTKKPFTTKHKVKTQCNSFFGNYSHPTQVFIFTPLSTFFVFFLSLRPKLLFEGVALPPSDKHVLFFVVNYSAYSNTFCSTVRFEIRMFEFVSVFVLIHIFVPYLGC